LTKAERRDGIEEALRLGGGTHTYQDVVDQLQMGEAYIFENEDGLIVVEVHDTPRKRVLHFWLATGNLDAVIALSYEAEAWGKTIGCEMATIAGRRGWERVLKSEGWSPLLSYMGKKL
jgi:hypothetical protein